MVEFCVNLLPDRGFIWGFEALVLISDREGISYGSLAATTFFGKMSSLKRLEAYTVRGISTNWVLSLATGLRKQVQFDSLRQA